MARHYIDSKRAVLSIFVTQSEKCIYIKAGFVHDAKRSLSKTKISGTRTSTYREEFSNFAVHNLGVQHELAKIHVGNLAYGEHEDGANQRRYGGRNSKHRKRRPVRVGKSTQKRSKPQPSEERIAQQRSGGKSVTQKEQRRKHKVGVIKGMRKNVIGGPSNRQHRCRGDLEEESAKASMYSKNKRSWRRWESSPSSSSFSSLFDALVAADAIVQGGIQQAQLPVQAKTTCEEGLC
jgi:hypothetical protein